MVAESMWWVGWLRSLCGGWVLDFARLRLSQPSLVKLKLGLSLAIKLRNNFKKRIKIRNKGNKNEKNEIKVFLITS